MSSAAWGEKSQAILWVLGGEPCVVSLNLLSHTGFSARSEFAVLIEARPGDGVDDGLGIEAILAIEVGDVTRLAETIDAQGHDAVPGHGTQPGKRRRMAIEDSHKGRVGAEGIQQGLDVRTSFRLASTARVGGGQPVRVE